MRQLSSPIIGSLAVICTYTLARAGVYLFFPGTTQDAWFFRDTLMCLPRLGAFAALLLLNRRWQLALFEMPPRDFGRAARLGFVPTILWVFYFAGGYGHAFTPFRILVGAFTSLIVGVYEEYAFRGPLLDALRQRMSLLPAIALSSALFTIFHLQAQPVQIWGAIFLMGVIFANLRVRGLGLGWLALIHGVIDAFYFVFTDNAPNPFGLFGLVLQAGLLAYAIATLPTGEKSPKP